MSDAVRIKHSHDFSSDGVEVLHVETDLMNITSVYKPPPIPFKWPARCPLSDKIHLVIGDFNSHNTIWGYEANNKDGEAVEEWALAHNLALIHSAKDPHSFHSARWKKGYNPDLVFVTDRHRQSFKKVVLDPIPKSQHRPILVELVPVVRPVETKPQVRFNYRKADWEKFTSSLDSRVGDIEPIPQNYETFQRLIWKIAKECIPRGCRKEFIPGLDDNSKTLYEQYVEAYEQDPLADNTIHLGEELLSSLNEVRKERWRELVSSVDMTHNSKQAWKTVRKLNTESQPQACIPGVTPNQVATQLVKNGKPQNRERGYKRRMKEEIERISNECDDIFLPFTPSELAEALIHVKVGKASGLDGISAEMLKHFGDRALSWLLALFNTCATTSSIPKIWRRAKVAALLKPGKDPKLAKSYRPISLLCILFKVYERLLLTRISPTVEDQLSTDQSGFRVGRSCCGQVLNLTQYIEDGFERGQITGTVFVDLTAAYDTVNHRALLMKVARMIKNTAIVSIIRSLLTNRRFYVEMNGKKSRWRDQKNGLPQGSVLAPVLFNIYTNDQPSFRDIRRFIYADDLCLATQSKSFNEIEKRLTQALAHMSEYYRSWFLNANPGKTQVCAFHLSNKDAKRALTVVWEGKILEVTTNPVYLGVTLDRTLSFSGHVQKLRQKISSRNNLLSKLSNSTWGAECGP